MRPFITSLRSTINVSQRTCRISPVRRQLISINNIQRYSYSTQINSTKSNNETTSQLEQDNSLDADDEMNQELSIDLHDLPSKWNKLSSQEQSDILEYLQAKQLFAWRYLTPDDKRAIYYISYGKYGPRANEISDSLDKDSNTKNTNSDKPLNLPEFIFKIISSSILFAVVGVSLLNYARDKEVVAKIEELEESMAGSK